jgi:hypothetical protein
MRKMEIDEKIIVQATEQILAHLQAQRDRIGLAFTNNSEILDIGLKCRFSYARNKFKIQTDIKFIESLCKDQAVTWYDPEQMSFSDIEPEKTE